MTAGRVLRLVAAATLAAAGTAVLPVAPASAATCSSATGVSVVVDFSLLGGSVAATCVAGGGGDTARELLDVDHELTPVNQFPGAVCKVDGAPADAHCERMPPTDAYWGLFWSDGSGGWVYSSEGVDGLNVPDGGSVALAWQDGGDRDQPGIAPPQHASSPEPSPSPSPGGGETDGQGDGNGDQGGQGGQPNGSSSSPGAPATSAMGADPTATATDADEGDRDGKRDKGETREKRDGRDRGGKASDAGQEDGSSPTPEADPSDAVPAASEPPAGAGDGGLPLWVAPLGIAALFGVAGAVALLRRRSTAP